MTMTLAEVQQKFEREQEAYWEKRSELLKHYKGKWIAIVNGEVAAIGDNMQKVAFEAYKKTGSQVMFVTQVGNEEPEFKVRQVVTGHFDSNRTPPIPTIKATVSNVELSSQCEEEFIVDTGANISLLRSDVGERLGLLLFPFAVGRIRGLSGEGERRWLFATLVHLAGKSVFILTDIRDDINENIMGRDVLNEFLLTICAKQNRVTVEWVDD